ncbi:MAG TPA: DUF1566 domain-containing protein [Panacibacter sp.]|nr:DUF1566 domain-containing protein [Panacibacter sp.]HNP45977.1 DUF1566 domain-containing protein [Panacibacter sp.]
MKRIIKAAMGCIMLLAISCSKQPLGIPQSVNTQTNDNANSASMNTAHYIGERFGGGVIFWITKDSLHGLIADTVDLGSYAWWNGIYTNAGATATRIGSRKANTRKIIVSQGRAGYYAALYSAKSKHSGYTDWFLPSKDELNEIYKNKAIIGGSFFLSGYWSSSESNENQAWGQRFDDGYQYFDLDKHYASHVRAIRAF